MKNIKIIPLIIAIMIVVVIAVVYFISKSNNSNNQISNNSMSVNTNNQNNNSDTKNSNGKVLVAYYSLTNTTEKVAYKIQEKTNGDIFKITPVNAYPTDHDECSEIAQKEKANNTRPELATHVENMEDYDIVFIGYPIWWYTSPMLIRTFVEEYDFSGKTVIPFCTSGGFGIEESEEDIKELVKNATFLKGIQLRSMSDSELDTRITNWFEQIGINDTIKQLNQATSSTNNYEETTNITLTINGTVIPAVLNNSPSSEDLISRLPTTLHLSRGSRDYCGGISPELNYNESDVKNGYKNGDLAFWTAGNDFVIFIEKEETSNEVGSIVNLGRITTDVEVFKDFGNSFDITINLAE